MSQEREQTLPPKEYNMLNVGMFRNVRLDGNRVICDETDKDGTYAAPIGFLAAEGEVVWLWEADPALTEEVKARIIGRL